MPEQLFDIYFRGEALDGFAPQQVQQNVAKLFKASPEKVQQLFSGKVVALKKSLDKATALKFQTVLKNAGAKIYIKQAETAALQTNQAASPAQARSAPVQTAPPQSVTAKPTVPTPVQAQDTALNILPVGADVLTEAERPAIQAADIDTSQIKLRSAFDTSADAPVTEQVSAPDGSHITAAEVGADILQGVAKPATPPAPDTLHIELGNVGERLVEAHEEIPLPSPDISNIELAEPGADMDPSEKKAQPPAPDSSHIQLQAQ